MREVRFILPYHRRGVTPDPGHRYVERKLLAHFGGFSARQIVGSWLDNGTRYDDTSIEYAVAVQTDSATPATVARNVAIEGAGLNEQLALYFVGTNGDVDIIDIRRDEAAA